jgi:hypothetical protein
MPAPGARVIAFVDPREGPDTAIGLTTALADRSRLVVAADREPLEQVDVTVLSVFGLGFLLALALSGLGAWLLGAWLQRRLGALSRAAEDVVGGSLAGRMPVGPGDDEFDRLARSLNFMLDRIESLVENVRQVSGDVAHDLRTPLAGLRNRLEAGLAESVDTVPAGLIEEAIRRLDEVLAIFAAILRIAEVEGGQIRRRFGAVDLSAQAKEIVESWAPAVADGGRRLEWSIAPGLEVDGDRELLAQALVNLLENAQRHTPPGTAIHVTLAAADDRIRLAVADQGPGVAEADRPRIVRRFVRLEGSRTTPGHGLGLSLVAAVAQLHGAVLDFADNAPGLLVTLEFLRGGR